ncbi:MAG: methylenetetrahydrofolate reductase [NAD(P)H] [Nevskiaceae bacterium]|nr:MAG: methylenetetrahydrofolate reductase [NAD(P)H] [Nevskiaceae bacterium]
MNTHPVTFSFELFPPRTPEGTAKLPAVIARLAELRPEYFSVTYGAGGSDQDGTYETVMRVVQQTGIEAAPHLTCVGSTREKIKLLLDRYRAAGIRRIVALRGDLPATALGAQAPGELHYANELVSFIRELHGDHFHLEVAAYPETHPQATSPAADFENFRRKVAAGADVAVSQYFYNADSYFDFVERCGKAGLKIPVIAGIMPITNHAQLTRFSAACGAEIPRWVRLRLEQYQDDRQALLDFGLDVVTRLCRTLLDNGCPGLHFYTLNQSEATLRLWKNLGLPVPVSSVA